MTGKAFHAIGQAWSSMLLVIHPKVMHSTEYSLCKLLEIVRDGKHILSAHRRSRISAIFSEIEGLLIPLLEI